MKTWLVACSKGGVGKTTLATHLAAACALGGRGTVMVDADPQASSTRWCERRAGLDAAVLRDGDIRVPNDGKTLAVGVPKPEVDAVLTQAGEPTDTVHLAVQALLVRSGDRVLLFDTGAGDADFADAGRLPASLRAAGVEPARVKLRKPETTVGSGSPEEGRRVEVRVQ